MSAFDDKLDQILSSPDAMEQIRVLAQKLSGTEGDSAPAPSSASASPSSSVLADLDPGLIEKLLTLAGEYRSGQDDKVALLNAMRPFLSEARSAKIDHAIRYARIARVVRMALELLGKEGGNV